MRTAMIQNSDARANKENDIKRVDRAYNAYQAHVNKTVRQLSCCWLLLALFAPGYILKQGNITMAIVVRLNAFLTYVAILTSSNYLNNLMGRTPYISATFN